MTKILIVDDHAVVREGLKRALSLQGYEEIHEADSIETARAQIALVTPQVITVDINLPDGTGFELITWVRSLSKEIAIVVVSLHDDANSVMAAKKGWRQCICIKVRAHPPTTCGDTTGCHCAFTL